MKKREIFILIFVLSTIILTSFIIVKTTGEATQTVGINITITAPPALTLLSPENETYINNKSILLNYTVGDQEWVKYSLDSGTNITLTSSIYFNASEGGHILYLYANNSEGLRTKNVSFTVDSTKFKIDYNKYKGPKRGDSINFTIYSYEDIQNLSNILLEHAEYGKIEFNEKINVTNDEDLTDNMVNISAHTNISSNRIELNSSALPNFNKSATLYLYNLTFSDPRILRDGSVCSSTICTRESYSGGTLKFNVTEFTIYSAGETPVIPTVTPSGGGGGGVSIRKSFSVNPEEIKIKLKQGSTTVKTIIIKNTGNTKIKISLKNPKLEEFLKINPKEFIKNVS